MLEISQAAEYGVRGMMYMAQLDGMRPVLVKEIAEAEEISPTFLHKIFQSMVRSRLLNSRRGVGYTFARAPEEITMLDVIEAIEGPVMLRQCVVDSEYCERSPECKLISFWVDIQNDLVAKLSAITIRSLVTPRGSGEAGES